MNGTEATKIIRKKGFVGPIYAVTGDAFDKDQMAFLKAGAGSYSFNFLSYRLTASLPDRVFMKPVNTRELLKAICQTFPFVKLQATRTSRVDKKCQKKSH